MRELRFGVIGCGEMGGVHCNNARFVPGMKTVAYCDHNLPKAEAFLEQFGGEYATADADRLLADPGLDGVLIQTGEVAHPGLVIAAAQAGKHIFCEKPIARTLEEAAAAAEAVARSGVKFLYGVNNRLAPMTTRAKRIIPDPVYSLCQCAESVTHHAVHFLDLAVNLFHDAPLVRVYAQGGQVWNLDPHLPADSFIATLTFADASVHCLVQHGAARNGTLHKYQYQLFGREGCVYLAERFKRCIVHDAEGKVTQLLGFDVPDWGGEGAHSVRGPYGYMGHYEEMAHLCECIREDRAPRMSAGDAVHVLAVEKAILDSLGTGAAVDFGEFCRRHGLRREPRGAAALA